MKIKIIAGLIGIFVPFVGLGQNYSQYFDGADTIYDPNISPSSIRIIINGDSTSTWQIGQPQKIIFDSAATPQNAILTDTVNYYPISDSSSFQYTIVPWTSWGILAIQWKQKLDMDFGFDGGIVEFSVDSGNTWSSAFNNPHVYNFYGYDTNNVDTLQNGQLAFTGTDSSWKDIWLCYDMSWIDFNDSVMIRHTFLSDSIDTGKEGWMIDNLLVHITLIHTVNEIEQKDYMTIIPNPTSGRIDISTRKFNGFHIIEKMELVNVNGEVVQEWGTSPTKFYVNIGSHPNGIYFLKVKTNIKTETFKIVLDR